MTTSERFWMHVDKKLADGCWEWQGHISKTLYPSVYVGKDITADTGKRRYLNGHRLSWLLTHGSIPDNLWVLHRCDNHACVRPDHLFLGTVTDNNRDCTQKGRRPKGDRSPRRLYPHLYRAPNRKLSNSNIIEIRRQKSNGKTFNAIAKSYGVAESTIKRAVYRKTWADVA